jgi:hypothetical protein
VPCKLVAGHGVASGRAATSPYPAGTIHLQAPFFAARGIDLAPYFAGTLNLEASWGHWRLNDPDERVEALAWTDRHPPETFSFWHCRLRVPIAPRGQRSPDTAANRAPRSGNGAPTAALSEGSSSADASQANVLTSISCPFCFSKPCHRLSRSRMSRSESGDVPARSTRPASAATTG